MIRPRSFLFGQNLFDLRKDAARNYTRARFKEI